MKARFLYLSMTLIVVFATGWKYPDYSSFLPTPIDIKEQLIEEVLELSGWKATIERTPEDIPKALFAQRPKDLSPEVAEKIVKIVTKSYQADKLYQVVVEHFKDNFDGSRLSTMLQWLNSPLSKKITQLEVQASTPEAMQEMEKFAAQLQSNPPAQERLALLRRLDKVTGTSELLIRMDIANFRCIFNIINRVLPPEKRLEEAKMEQLCNVRKAQSRLHLKNGTLAGFLYTYGSLSDAELTKYIDFCESDVGQWFNRVSGGATMKAMAIAAEEVGRQMAKLLLEE